MSRCPKVSDIGLWLPLGGAWVRVTAEDGTWDWDLCGQPDHCCQ
jgi:hypothetical protein